MRPIVPSLAIAVLSLISASGCASGRAPFAQRNDEPSVRLTAKSTNAYAHETQSTVAADRAKSAESVKSPVPIFESNIQLTSVSEELNDQAAEKWTTDSSEVVVENASQVALTLADIEQLALANNPTIRQQSASSEKARAFRSQVGVKANPTIGYFGSQIADAGTDQHGAFVEQEFVRGDKLRLNQRVLDRSVQAQLWDAESQRYRVLTDVRVQFYEVLAAQRRIELTDSFYLVTEKGTEISRRRKEAMETSQVELLQAEVQMAQIDVARKQAKIAFTGAWRELMATTGVPNKQPTALNGELNPRAIQLDWDATYQNLLSNSPELNAARSRIQRARANQQRQEAQAIPNITAQLGAGSDNATGSGLINLQVGAPVPVFNQNSGNISAAYAEYCRATHEVTRIEASIKARLARAGQEFDSASVAVQEYESTILPKARETLQLSERAFSAGEFDFLQVLIVRRTFFEANLSYVQSLADLAQAHARIDGLLLTGGLDQPTDFQDDDSLRGQTFSQQ